MNSPIPIAIYGFGSAGRSREKALEKTKGLKLAGIISRRPAIGNLSWEEALNNPQIQAIAISTENTNHTLSVCEALKAHKHVLVDYPLAFSQKEAKQLFELAKEQNKVLHVEHLSLLSEAHQKAKRKLASYGKLKKGSYHFEAGWNSKLADPNYLGPSPFMALPRLMQLADLLGPFQIKEKIHSMNESHFDLRLLLEFEQGGSFQFEEVRRPHLNRSRHLDVEMEKAPFVWKVLESEAGLFLKDLEWFGARILTGKPCYYDEEMMINVIGELEKIK